MPEHDDSAIAFGQRMLALLDTGSFTASYKYAVLLALIDAVLEGADDQGDPPASVHAIDIGRRVLAIYWRQARPFTADGPLRQSRQRDIVTKIDEFRRRHRLDGLVTVEAARRAHPTDFADLERDVVATVVRYPIPLLQKVGIGRRAVEQRFIYAYGWAEGVSAAVVHRSGFDDRMHLVGDAGAHLMALAGLLRPVIQRDWLEFVARRNDADVEELRLQRHLFGGDRVSLRPVADPLLDLQDGRCFYCDRIDASGWQVDHFLPWSRWPDDRLDNLVLAHERCNNDKRAALAGLEHVQRWWARSERGSWTSGQLGEVADLLAWPRSPSATRSAARAVYLHQPDGSVLWVGRPSLVEVLDRPRLLEMLSPDLGLAADDPGAYEP